MNRKKLKDNSEAAKNLKARYERLKSDITDFFGSATYDSVVEHFDNLIEQYIAKLDALPIGHRYSGCFYIKTPYSTPSQFEKIEGSAYMREDLISWEVKKSDGRIIPGYFRNIYKDEKGTTEITRDDAGPVYRKNTLLTDASE